MRQRESQLSRRRLVELIMFSKRTFALATIALFLAAALAFSRLPTTHPSKLQIKTPNWPTFRANQTRTGSLDHLDGPSTPKILWTFRETTFTPSDFSSSPAIVANRIFVASANIDAVARSGFIYCIDATTGQKTWQFPGYHIDESPLISGDILLVGTGYDRASYLALDLKTGHLLWHRDMEASVWGTSALAGDRVYFGLSNAQVGGTGPADLGKIYCIDIKTGHDIWTAKLPRAVGTAMTLADDQLFFGCWDGNVYCLNRTTGQQIWK